MWVNPRLRDQSEPSAPPPEKGERLATFPRGRGEELRVTLAEYQGHPFISLRVWAPDRDGRLWPVKGKGCSLRIRELPDLVVALEEVSTLLDRRQARQDGPGPGHAGRDGRSGVVRPRRSREALGRPLDSSLGFDECEAE